jgi:hypothetical protein
MSMENRVEKAIKSFYSSMKENVDYVDLNFRGIANQTKTFTDDDGNKKQYVEQTVGIEGVACLRDKFRIWLMSDDGDFHRNPGEGGFLAKNVVKRPFIEASCPVIEALLKSAAESKFPQLEIYDVKVYLDKPNRRWNIKVSILDKKTGIIDNTMYVNGEAISVASDS